MGVLATHGQSVLSALPLESSIALFDGLWTDWKSRNWASRRFPNEDSAMKSAVHVAFGRSHYSHVSTQGWHAVVAPGFQTAFCVDDGTGDDGRLHSPALYCHGLREKIASVAPLGWNHINLTGDYRWQGDKRVAKDPHSDPSADRCHQGGGLSVQKFPFLEVTPCAKCPQINRLPEGGNLR